ncbi:MAG: hypothetical protein ACXW3M_07005, partial [Rhodoplanes sp.]
TGTLTEGRPALVDVVCLPGVERDDILRLAGAVQAGSEHPLAKAVLAAVSGVALPPAERVQAQIRARRHWHRRWPQDRHRQP